MIFVSVRAIKIRIFDTSCNVVKYVQHVNKELYLSSWKNIKQNANQNKLTDETSIGRILFNYLTISKKDYIEKQVGCSMFSINILSSSC